MGRLVFLGCLLLVPAVSISQQNDFVGSWLLWVEAGNQGEPAYGSLDVEQAGDTLAVYVDGGPAALLELEGNRIGFEFDWDDLWDLPHVSVLNGMLENGVISGTVRSEGQDRGAWRATRRLPVDRNAPPEPADLNGIWGPPALISRHTFDLTEAGRAADAAYDPTLDDPILRCVSDGLVRMSHGPFHIEVLEGDGRVVVIHEDLHEVRRIYTDGRGFPEGIEDAGLAMGFSIGHWEGSTFVIETRGLKRTVWDAAGMPISPSAIVTERWYLDDTGRLHIEISMDDPENYHRPVLMHIVRSKRPADTVVPEYACDPHGFYRGLEFSDQLQEYWGRSGNRL
ncbi:MAG: hypothetical protein HKN84_01830 [Gammaproteobacteria bacterium]|nr:hypothetical protein [Gammaproteobacteria bacterium]